MGPASGPGLSWALTAPAFAMSGAAGGDALRTTFSMIAASRMTQSTPAAIHAVRSRDGTPAGAAPAPAGRPQRWQNRACGARSARQPAHARATRLAPQALQKFPEAGVPHAGHGEGVAVIGAEA